MFKVTYAYFQFWKRVIFLSTETISSQYIYIYLYWWTYKLGELQYKSTRGVAYLGHTLSSQPEV